MSGRLRERDSRDLTVHQHAHFAKWSIAIGCSARQIRQVFVRGVVILQTDATSKSALLSLRERTHPELLITVARGIEFGIDLYRVLRHCHIELRSREQRKCLILKETRTEKIGGTEASSPVLFARVVTGIMVFARGAGGWAADDA